MARATERRPDGGAPLGSPQHYQERERVNARRGRRGQKRAEDFAPSCAARHAHQGAVRSVGIRQSLDRRLASRRRHRRWLNCIDDRTVSRLMAVNIDRYDRYTAFPTFITYVATLLSYTRQQDSP